MRPSDGGGIDGRRYAGYAQTATTQAAILRSAAIRVADVAGRVDRVVGKATFSAPSAVRFRQRTHGALADLRADAARLTDLADQLDRVSAHYSDLYLAWHAGH